ncbi:MAG: glycosyltransferase [Planctomycetota bacterium]
MRLAYVVGRYPLASEIFIRREVEMLRRLGHAVAIWPCGAREPRRGSPWIGDSPPGLPERPLRIPWAARTMWRHPRLALRYAHRTDHAAAALGPADLVLAHFASETAFCGRSLARIREVPFAVSVHARDVFVPWKPGLAVLCAAQRIFACSREVHEAVRPRLADRPERLSLIHHGVPEDLFRMERTPRAQKTLLAAGRLVPKKGFDVLLQALPRLLPQFPNLSLHIAGTGPLLDRLRKAVSSLNVENCVHFLGELTQEDLAAEMRRAHVFCAPSRIAEDGDRDGIPNVVLEAMAAGLPVVSCDAGGLGEVVTDYVTGRLVPPEEPEALAVALLEWLAEPQKASAAALRAKERMRADFSLEKNVRELAAALEGMIGS